MDDMARDNSSLFAPVAADYVQFRPRYPDSLFDYLATAAPRRQMAWDCGCGSGQATLELADRFVSVLASDASAEQIMAAPAHPHVRYRVAQAEDSGLAAGSVDLVTVAQALHWFDQQRFHAEVARVLAPDGVIAVWSYGILRMDEPELDDALQHFRTDGVGAYWPPERRHVDNGYIELPFPYAELRAPRFVMETQWNLPQLLGYLRSWSATGRYQAERGSDPTVSLAARLLPLWGDPYALRYIRWPLTLRVGRPKD